MDSAPATHYDTGDDLDLVLDASTDEPGIHSGLICSQAQQSTSTAVCCVLRCVLCGLNISKLQRHTLEIAEVRCLIQRWIGQVQVTSDSIVCHACWTNAWDEIRHPTRSEPKVGHVNVCIGCGSSLLRKRSHRLNTNTTRETAIRNMVAQQIAPRQLARTTLLCHTCWRRIDRAASRSALEREPEATKHSPSIESEGDTVASTQAEESTQQHCCFPGYNVVESRLVPASLRVEEADICDDNMNDAEDDSNTLVESNDEEAGICDDNMDDAEDDTNALVESNVCRVCLAMDVKMYDLKDTELRGMFQNVTGICVPENNHSILERLCWECVGRLKTAAAFRNKALVSDTLLQGLASTGEQIRKNDITTIKENKEYLRPVGTLSVVEVFHPVDIDPENDSEPHILENNVTNIVEHTVGKDSREIKKENIIDEDGDQLVIKDEPMIEYPIKTETEYDQFDYLYPNTGEDSRNVFTKTNPLVGNDIRLSKNKISLPDSSPLPGCSHADPKYPVVGSLQNTLNNCKDKIKTNAILVINKKDL